MNPRRNPPVSTPGKNSRGPRLNRPRRKWVMQNRASATGRLRMCYRVSAHQLYNTSPVELSGPHSQDLT